MKKLLIALIAASVMPAVHAEGIYAGASTWRSQVDMDVVTQAASTSFSDKVRTGKLFAGIELNKTWGVEGGYIDFGKVSKTYALGAVPGNFSTDGHAWYAAGKGSYAFNEDWSAFGKLGLARSEVAFSIDGAVSASDKASKTGAYLGAGIQYQLTKSAALMVELERYGRTEVQANRAGVKNGNTFSVGARFNF